MNSDDTINILIQGGAVGISLALIGLVWFIIKTGIDFAKDWISKQTQAITDLLVAIKQLIAVIDAMKSNR